MKYTPEQFAKAKACKSVEELLAYTKEICYPLLSFSRFREENIHV